jgi:hypothetical protein
MVDVDGKSLPDWPVDGTKNIDSVEKIATVGYIFKLFKGMDKDGVKAWMVRTKACNNKLRVKAK